MPDEQRHFASHTTFQSQSRFALSLFEDEGLVGNWRFQDEEKQAYKKRPSFVWWLVDEDFFPANKWCCVNDKIVAESKRLDLVV